MKHFKKNCDLKIAMYNVHTTTLCVDFLKQLCARFRCCNEFAHKKPWCSKCGTCFQHMLIVI